MKNELDFLPVLENLSDDAFVLCKKSLFPMFSHPVITLKDYRRMDCIEDMYDLEKDYFLHHKTKDNHIVYFVECLKFYFDNYLLCKPGTCAAKYSEHAKNLIAAMIGSNKPDFATLCDIVKIYICLAREDAPNFNDESKQIEKITFELKLSDIDVLDTIRNYQFKIPQKLELPKEFKLGPIKADNIFALTKYLDNDKRKFDYVNTVLLYYIIMNDEGLFKMEDNAI